MRKHTLLAALLRAPLFMAVLCAALSVFTGCGDLFNFEELENEEIKQYTVTFDANGGSPAIQTRTVTGGETLGELKMPSAPTMDGGRAFGGWYTGQNGGGGQFTASTPVSADITVYANWTVMPTTSLQAAFDWLDSHAAYVPEGVAYTITLQSNETLAPRRLSSSGKSIFITIQGDATERTVNLSTAGSLFTVEKGVTLTLGPNVTLQGRSDNTVSLVTVNSGGALFMNTGSKITGNTSTSAFAFSSGGGVSVVGTFTMSGGEITGNSSSSVGGGVSVAGLSGLSTGKFVMSGGKISGNTAAFQGGGVNVSSGTFTMSNGEISDNSGGGVDVSGGTFTMKGGKISGNSRTSPIYNSYGGGVLLLHNSTFTMSGGEISGNTADKGGGSYAYGGGVHVADSTFTMSGGKISGNSASSYGGGVSVIWSSTFTMSGGEISGNIAANGGGVHVYSAEGTFTKQSGGIIYGSDESDNALKNTATAGDGHAVYVDVDLATKKRNTTAGTGVTLDSTVDGSTGGWE